MICATVNTSFGCESVMVEPPMVIRPGAVLMGVLGVTMPLSSASAVMKGFMVEPGSKLSVSTRLRSCSPLRFTRRLGL